MTPKKPKKPITPDAARLRMADLCARSEQCEADIRTKLIRMAIPQADADDIISFLRSGRFIDDERFASGFSRDKCRFSSWGRQKIRLALVAKRLPKEAITAGLAAIEKKDYLDALRRVTLAKGRTLDLFGENAREERLKLYRHIISRGFESALALKAVESYLRHAQRKSEES